MRFSIDDHPNETLNSIAATYIDSIGNTIETDGGEVELGYWHLILITVEFIKEDGDGPLGTLV